MLSHLPDPMAADIAACRELLRGGSRTFFAASHVLPRCVSGPATALYAFCRLADDAVDLQRDKLASLARLRHRLDRAYEGRPYPAPADRAFADVIARFALPRELPEALLEGLEGDVAGRRYEDLSSLTDYAVRVAGSVGAMMSLLMGARTPQLLARACDLGVAMQFTNIARDVGEDASHGRLYLPLQWLRGAGIDPDAWLGRPVFSTALGGVVARLLREADVLYERADVGIAQLPFACQPGIRAARQLYTEIGREVERRGCDSVSRRASVSWPRKALALTQSITDVLTMKRSEAAPQLGQARYLIDAVSQTGVPAEAYGTSRDRSHIALEARLVWLIDLFERLERREQRSCL
jgi:15-cis-phytoene synthase